MGKRRFCNMHKKLNQTLTEREEKTKKHNLSPLTEYLVIEDCGWIMLQIMLKMLNITLAQHKSCSWLKYSFLCSSFVVFSVSSDFVLYCCKALYYLGVKHAHTRVFTSASGAL